MQSKKTNYTILAMLLISACSTPNDVISSGKPVATPTPSQSVASSSPTPSNTPTTQQKDSDIKTFTETNLNISIKEGQDFIIQLSSNATTGYKWGLSRELNQEFLKSKGFEYISPFSSTPVLGAGGFELWKFTALKKGETEIKLKYFREWEKDTPPVNEVTFKVKIL